MIARKQSRLFYFTRKGHALNIPVTLQAGDTITWRDTLIAYPPSDGWILKYALAGNNPISITSTASGNDHLFNLAPAVTTTWTPGKYQYQAFVTRGTEQYTVETGQTEVLRNFRLQGAGYDVRSHNQKMLDAIKATELGRATKEESQYTIGSGINQRSLSRLSPEELYTWRKHYEEEVKIEAQRTLIEQGKSPGNTIKIQF